MAETKRKAEADNEPPNKKTKSKHETQGVQQDRQKFSKKPAAGSKTDGRTSFLNGQSSREAHHKQKQVKAERVAAKPNADAIARSKKIWERLRIKSAVPRDERKQLVDELFSLITGRIPEFVFKHDAVRVIQCALKYASPEQKMMMAGELRGSYRELAESKYAKFLVAKMITEDKSHNHQVRDLVVPEFYGHVKRLIRHPEASWIMDDIYRTLATEGQKARLLREWYGGEFAVPALLGKDENVTSDLSEILNEAPGKRGPIMSHLKEMTNQLVQKKTTGFTMLHDALLQYFLQCAPGSPEHTEFLDMLRDDEDGDLFKNLAFTKSGARLVCLALARGTSKDRRNILKHYKTHVRLMAADGYAHLVLLTAMEVIDDTVMTAKAIVPELTCKELEPEARDQELLLMAANVNARIPMLYPMAGEPPKWLLDGLDREIIAEVREIRKATSKKDPETRRLELNKAISQPLLDFVAAQAKALASSSYGCQFLGEVLVGAVGDKDKAVDAVARLAAHESAAELLATPYAGRLFKMLVQGGHFDPAIKTVVPCDPPLKFAETLYATLRQEEDAVKAWAIGPNSWSIVAMLENDGFDHKDELLAYLKEHNKELAAPKADKAANAGTKVLLEKIGADSRGKATEKKRKATADEAPEQKKIEKKQKGEKRAKKEKS